VRPIFHQESRHINPFGALDNLDASDVKSWWKHGTVNKKNSAQLPHELKQKVILNTLANNIFQTNSNMFV
jgi:hypothetical protein